MSCKSCNSFGENCPYHKQKFGGRSANIEREKRLCRLKRLAYDPQTKKCVQTQKQLEDACRMRGLVLDLRTRKCKLPVGNSQPSKSTSFGTNCHPQHKTQFGMFPCGVRRVTSFPASRPASFTHQRTRADSILNEFGVKASSVKGYSSLTKQHLTSFYMINGIDIPMSATKDQLYSNLKGIYSGLTPADIKNSVATNDTIANIRAAKQSQKEAEQIAKREALEEKQRLKLQEIKKITYSPRSVPKEFEFVSRRLPAGSKVKRLTRPQVTQVDIDDLADMFSAARASPDEMSDLLTKLRVNNFGA